MNTKDLDLMNNVLKYSKELGADDAEVLLAKGESKSVEFRLGKVEALESSSNGYELGLTLYLGKRTANVSSSNKSNDELKKMTERCFEMAKVSPENIYAGIASSDKIAKEFKKIDLLDTYVPSTQKLLEMSQETEDSARSVNGISNSDGASASWGKTNFAMLSSNGFYGNFSGSIFSLSVSVVAGSAPNMETDYDFSSKVFFEDLQKPNIVGLTAAERAVKRLKSKKCKTGKFPVIFDKRVSKSIASHIASAINGSAVANGTSLFKDKMGEQVLNSSINVIDDPNLHRGLGSSPFDGEGLAKNKLNMIENGILKNWLLDLSSSRQLEVESNANAIRGIGSNAYPGPSNFMILPSKRKFKTLFEDIKEGLLITELIGSSVNMITGDYSRGASGFWIDNGEITYPISEVTIAGNLNEMFLNMIVSDDIDLSSRISSPSIRIDNMTIAGN